MNVIKKILEFLGIIQLNEPNPPSFINDISQIILDSETINSSIDKLNGDLQLVSQVYKEDLMQFENVINKFPNKITQETETIFNLRNFENLLTRINSHQITKEKFLYQGPLDVHFKCYLISS